MASQKNKFANEALKIIKEHPGVFKALEDFEKTGRLTTKSRLNFTIDSEVARKFRNYCKKCNCNMSKIVENLIKKQYLNKMP